VITDDVADTTARALGMQLQRVPVRSAADLPAAFTTVLGQRAQALFVYPLPVGSADIKRIAEFAVTNKLPATTLWDGYAEQGFLLFYGTSAVQQSRQAGIYIDKIIKGARPADLPVEQPTKLDLVIDRKTAKALGLTIPPSLLARADEVIE
jgi:putative ABC transport system substrate-binding protein